MGSHARTVVGYRDPHRVGGVTSDDPDQAVLPPMQCLGGVEDQVEQGVFQVPLDSRRGTDRGIDVELETRQSAARAMKIDDELERLANGDRAELRRLDGVQYPREQVERAAQVGARFPENLLEFGVRIAQEIGQQRQRLGGAPDVVQNPARRHAEGGGTVGRDQQVQVPIGRWNGGDSPTYTGFSVFPARRWTSEGARQAARGPAGRSRI